MEKSKFFEELGRITRPEGNFGSESKTYDFNGLSNQERVKDLVEIREFLKKEYGNVAEVEDINGNTRIFNEAYFGDFNDEEQDDAMKHWDEVTVFGQLPDYFPIEEIKTIEVYKLSI